MAEALESPASFGPEVTLDALSGHFKIHQYKDGHRFSTDDVLVAWYGTSHCPRADRVLDLGSGIGTVALISAWRLPGARFVTIEAQDISIRLARESVKWRSATVLMNETKEPLPRNRRRRAPSRSTSTRVRVCCT